MIHFNRMFYYKPSIFNYPHFRKPPHEALGNQRPSHCHCPNFLQLSRVLGATTPSMALGDLRTFGDQKNFKNRASQMLHVTQAHFQTEQIP